MERMARTKEDSNYCDLIDPIDIDSTSSIVYPEYSVVGISRHDGVGLIPLTGKFFFS